MFLQLQCHPLWLEVGRGHEGGAVLIRFSRVSRKFDPWHEFCKVKDIEMNFA